MKSNKKIVYKLLRKRKDGTLGPLFINKKQIIPIGEWLNAESHPTKGYAFRPFWHCCSEPVAPHLSTKNRVWCKAEIKQFKEFKRPTNQGGVWYLAEKIKIIKILT